MSKHWVRQEVKKNELADALEKSVGWFQSNRQQTLAGAGVALVVVLLGGYFAYQRLVLDRAAWRSLSIGQSLAYQGKLDDALSQLQTLSERFSGSPAWGFATLMTGDIYYRQAQYAKGVETYRKIADRQAPKTLVPLAISDQALAEEAGGNCRDSIETSRRFLEQFKDHYLAPQIHASMARCLKAMGRNEEAKSALQQMTTLYPADQDPYWNQWAQAHLKSPS